MKYIFSLITFIIFSGTVSAQVPVREEPRHKPVLQNKYFRLLDVWLQPGDTTLFHSHSTPSLFVVLSYTQTTSQLQGAQWVKDEYAFGKTWYRSFIPDSLVHRVANNDSIPFHVNDIELLSFYDSSHPKKQLPFPVIIENERTFAYQITNIQKNTEIIQHRGPIIAELVKGENIIFHNAITNNNTKLNAGKYLYIPPGNSFYFSTADNGDLNLVLLEIR